ncbi:LytR/AlgR family response regulator transcription factor [Flavobacterium hercynium]|uniref:DNA-binding response regulator n=1 Tax=Flavobacterium hercynium TaxID=387094 RepID=A0A226GML2_9FLAO|nr:LytTR family DNA-binding domain-containing protein [Flavobacterium hercynium]OXA83177.1 DNA-binding response regulator [Flavobacterium hercynium]SMP37253.1 two component transcriptional regulator, LytTR family [Flavobacterium hercynium]
MYKTIIIEDEQRIREALSLMLEMVAPDEVQIIAYAENVTEAVKLINNLKPDLVFMDIMLKDGTGFDVLQKIAFNSFHLIFTTAYEQHAINAFKYSAIDYLLKPIDSEELKTAIQRISLLQERVLEKQQINELQVNLSRTPERIILPTQEASYVVKLEQIVRCETSGSYTTFYLNDGRKIMVSKPLKNYEDLLEPPQFFRVHQSHLININCIVSYSREGMVHMNDKSMVPISRGKKESFFKLMKDEA